MSQFIDELFPNKSAIKPILRHTSDELKRELEEAACFDMNYASVFQEKTGAFMSMEHSVLNLFNKPDDAPIPINHAPIIDDKLYLYPVQHISLFGSLLSAPVDTTPIQDSKPILEINMNLYREKRRKLLHPEEESYMDIISRYKDSVIVNYKPSAVCMPQMNDTAIPETTEADKSTQNDETMTQDKTVNETPMQGTQGTQTDFEYYDVNTAVVRDVHRKTTDTGRYLPMCVPVYASPEQIKACDDIMKHDQEVAVELPFALFDSCIDTLNFNKDTLTLTEDGWKQSGKIYVLKQLLQQLPADMAIIILTRNMESETRLLTIVRDQFNISCTRIGNILDIEWHDEYGLFLKTGTSSTTQPRRPKGGCEADLVISMDFRITHNDPVFTKVHNRTNRETKLPVLWLVTVGSLEEKALYYIKENDIEHWINDRTVIQYLLEQKSQWCVHSEWMIHNNDSVRSVLEWSSHMQDDYVYVFDKGNEISSLPSSTPNEKASSADVSDMEVTDDDEPIPKVLINEDFQVITSADNKPKYTKETLLAYFDQVALPSFKVVEEPPSELPDLNISSHINAVYMQEMKGLKERFNAELAAVKAKYMRMVESVVDQYGQK